MRDHLKRLQGRGGLLQKGETILWQGKPATGIHLRLFDAAVMLFGLIVAGFALFWMSRAMTAEGDFWMFGLIHFSVGICLVSAPLIWQPFVRAHTFYALTDQRALISCQLPVIGDRLDVYPILAMTELSLDARDPGTVWFASRHSWSTSRPVRRIGFEYISDAAQVFALINRAQKENT